MIIVAGDSWACGEWIHSAAVVNDTSYKFGDGFLSIPHTGITQYLTDDGYQVLNLGEGNGSNFNTIKRLETALEIAKTLNRPVERIFVFQTEWDRDFRCFSVPNKPILSLPAARYYDLTNLKDKNIMFSLLGYSLSTTDNFYQMFNINSPDDLANHIIRHFYNSLSDLYKKYKTEIHVIGGCADTLESTSNVPGVHIVCQSMTNLIINHRDKVNEPVLSCYLFGEGQQDLWLRQEFPNHSTDLIKLMDLALIRLVQWEQRPGLFPDQRHPNREGHRILYEFLKTKNVIKL